MGSLLRLPDELLLLIVSYFDSFLCKNDLTALCLTSSRLCSIAQPVLHNQFVREAQCLCCRNQETGQSGLVSLIRFARTIVTRPDLGARVREASFDTFEEEDLDYVRKAALDGDTLETLQTGLESLPAAMADRLSPGIAGVSTNPYIALLAYSMPNLEHLYLVLGEEGLDELAPLFTSLPEYGVKQPFLKKLKSIVIKDMTDTCSESLSNIEHVLKLPHLQSFTINCLDGDSDYCPQFDIAPGTLNVSYLTFLETCLDAERLTRIVAGCKSLKFFDYRQRTFDNDGIGHCQFEALKLVSILESQTKSLKTLKLYLDWSEDYPETLASCSKIGSLASFTEMCHLEVDQYSLSSYPSEELPPSLHCLTIRNISFPIYSTLTSISGKHSNATLRVVTLEPRDGHPNEMLEIRNKFEPRKISSNFSVANKFRKAYARISDIIKEAPFTLYIEDETYEEWLSGSY